MRTNRKGFPADLKPVVKKGLKERGDYKTYQDKNLTVSAWKDNKVVVIAATNSDPTIEEEVTRKKKDGSTIPVKCPQSVVLYNKIMGGVDYNDQLRGYYRVRLKCKKFYKYIFWFLFDVAVTNSYVVTTLTLAFVIQSHSVQNLLGVSLATTAPEKAAVVLRRACYHPNASALLTFPSEAPRNSNVVITVVSIDMNVTVQYGTVVTVTCFCAITVEKMIASSSITRNTYL